MRCEIGLVESFDDIGTDRVVRAWFFQSLADTAIIQNLEIKIRTKAGDFKDVIFSADGIELNGQTHALITLLDITASKKTVEALRQSEAKYRLISENTADVIWTLATSTMEGRKAWTSCWETSFLWRAPKSDLI